VPKIRSVKFNFVMNCILTLSNIIFPLITFPYVSRILLPEGTGRVAFATSVVTYFSMFAQLGIPTYGIRACAKVREDKEKLTRTVHEIFFINIIMCVFAYIAFFAALLFIPRLQSDKVLFIVVSSTILFNALGMEWAYKALEQYSYITVRSVVFKLIALVAMFLLVKQQKDYIIYGGITIFAGVGSNILNFINIRKIISFRYVGHYDLKQHFKPILIFFAMSVATTIYTNLDNIMLGAIKGNIDVGYYNAAVKIKSILVSFVTSLGAVLLPRVSFYFDNGMKKEFRQITKKAIEFVVLLACPVTIYFIIYAKESILFLSGKAFVGAVIPMQLIMPTVLLIGLTNLMGIQMLVPMGFEKIVLYSEIAGATIDLIINFILIPPLASSGASIAALAAETTVFIVQFFALRKMVLPLFRKLEHSKIIMSLILSSALSLPIKMVPTGNFLKLVISALIFFGVYMIILNVLKEPLVIDLEKQVLAKYLNKLRPNVKEN